MLQQIVIADMTNLQWRYVVPNQDYVIADGKWSGDWINLGSVHYQQLYCGRDRSSCAA
jgi:hypothetical protein